MVRLLILEMLAVVLSLLRGEVKQVEREDRRSRNSRSSCLCAATSVIVTTNRSGKKIQKSASLLLLLHGMWFSLSKKSFFHSFSLRIHQLPCREGAKEYRRAAEVDATEGASNSPLLFVGSVVATFLEAGKICVHT